MVNAGQVVKASDVAVQACRVTRTGSQSVPNASDTVIAFDAEVFDNAGMHDVTTNNSRITIQKSGYYLVGGGLQYASASTYTNLNISIRLNGTSTIVHNRNPGTTTTTGQLITTNTIHQFNAGDYIEVIAFQSSGAARNVELAGDPYSPIFYAARIGS